MAETLTSEELDELERLSAEAFKAPWTYTRFQVECEGDENGDDCGGLHDCIQVDAHDEYPDGQCICQQNIVTPGLERFAEKNGALIAAMRNHLPALLALARKGMRLEEAKRLPVWRPLNGKCASASDGDCNHPDCPQTRDDEPNRTGRSCPLFDWSHDDD